MTLANDVLETCKAAKLTLATAESCTGGMVCASLVDIAGSSAVVLGGIISYSNEAKQTLLGVRAATLKAHGAVSEETVLAMTRGVIANSRANVAVAVSGIAGPDGGSEDKPVGTVWIAWQWQDKSLARCFQFVGDREAVRLAAVTAGLQGLIELIG